MTATLGSLAERLGARLAGPADPSTEVVDLTHDSREVAPGWLFAAVRGEHHDGHDHVRDARDRGAVGALVEREVPLELAQLVVGDSRAAMGPAAAAVHGDPSRRLALVGVTGTNGKTTVVSLVAQLLDRLGRRSAVIGTLTGARTTPEAPDLQRQLRRHVEAGVEVVAMEVSSHALALHRVDGCHFRVAAFTNLGRDHLDFHRTQERYFEAKAALFERDRIDLAVLNVGDVHGRLLRDVVEVPVVSVNLNEVAGLEQRIDGSRFRWRGRPVDLRLPGAFNVVNAVIAAEIVAALGIDVDEVATALGLVGAPPGRLEPVPGPPGGPSVFVDYAHTPDALAAVLDTLRGSMSGPARLVVVVGCGGDRDRAKRPEMAHVASGTADVVWLTSDNPRSEDPAAIMDEMVAGVRPDDRAVVHRVVDRAGAIGSAIADAGPRDVVLVAGKGHETTQTIGDLVLPFDDREVAAAALAARPSGGTGPS